MIRNIFSIALYHSYFKDNICKILQISPDASTLKILNKKGLFLKNSVGGLSILCNADVSIATILYDISDTEKIDYFKFYIKSTSPAFDKITAFPNVEKGLIVYSSENTVDLEDLNEIELKGIFTVNDKSDFVASIVIFFEDLIKLFNNSYPLAYHIHFMAKETQWLYYIINKNDGNMTNPAITEDGEIKFEGPEYINLPNGETALLFFSKNRNIPLSELKTHNFDLVSMTRNEEKDFKILSSKIIVKNLPSPNILQTTFDESQNVKQLVSPIYVYVQ